jgi:hypothetical protein
MATDHPQKGDPREGVDRLREADPQGPAQFDRVLRTNLRRGQAEGKKRGRATSSHERSEIAGLGSDDLRELKQQEKKFAAARRAAIAAGRTTLYE